MPKVETSSPDEYLAQLPPDRPRALTTLREVICRTLPDAGKAR